MKKLICLIMVICIAAACIGCTSKFTKSITYSVETGEKVKVSMEATDGYDLTGENEPPFIITYNGEQLSHGTFIGGEFYESYEQIVKEDPNAKQLAAGELNGGKYLFWSYGENEFNYIILLKGGKTAVILGNNTSEESAKAVFERLTIKTTR